MRLCLSTEQYLSQIDFRLLLNMQIKRPLEVMQMINHQRDSRIPLTRLYDLAQNFVSVKLFR